MQQPFRYFTPPPLSTLTLPSILVISLHFVNLVYLSTGFKLTAFGGTLLDRWHAQVLLRMVFLKLERIGICIMITFESVPRPSWPCIASLAHSQSGTADTDAALLWCFVPGAAGVSSLFVLLLEHDTYSRHQGQEDLAMPPKYKFLYHELIL
jgi:hypothetical protein